MNKIETKKMYWDDEYKKLIKNKKFFFEVKIYGSYYLFEDNTSISSRKEATYMLASFTSKSATADQWHQMIMSENCPFGTGMPQYWPQGGAVETIAPHLLGLAASISRRATSTN